MTSANEADLVIETALAMNNRGINTGTAGNVSIRSGDSMLITPSSTPYEQMVADDIVAVAPDGSWAAANGRHPSSEWRFHLDIYAARPDVGGIVHAHPVNATALAVHGRGLDPFHYMVAVAGGHNIRCAPYATFGTAELSANVIAALAGRTACFMEHHGMVAIGRDPLHALDVAVEVESLAAQYLASLAVGEPPLLDRSEMDAVLAKMAEGPGYGSST